MSDITSQPLFTKCSASRMGRMRIPVLTMESKRRASQWLLHLSQNHHHPQKTEPSSRDHFYKGTPTHFNFSSGHIIPYPFPCRHLISKLCCVCFDRSGSGPDMVIGREPWHRSVPEDWVPIITRDQGSHPPQNSSQPLQAPFRYILLLYTVPIGYSDL